MNLETYKTYLISALLQHYSHEIRAGQGEDEQGNIAPYAYLYCEDCQSDVLEIEGAN